VSRPVPIAATIAELRDFVRAQRAAGARIGLVPTMGALHDGHLSLIDAARQRADRVIATIFVNPTQFGANEDFSRYPRTFDADRARLAEVAADLVFAPSVADMYPEGFVTTVSLAGPATAGLEDRFRPEHFAGVATVVAKLLNQAQADLAVFGEKDYQQLLVIRQLARDLDIPTVIFGAPTLREPDGLARSSRNVYLSPQERARAPSLFRALDAAARAIAAGAGIDGSLATARRAVLNEGFVIDYIEARDARTLAPVADDATEAIRILAAARIGATRLIDNVAVPAA
jgi:pantoate--beta-alanine ligase